MLSGLSGLSGLWGAGSAPSSPTQATGFEEFADNPIDGDAMPALNNYPFIGFYVPAEGPPLTFPDIPIGGSLAETLDTLVTALEANKDHHAQLADATYTSDGVSKLIITYSTSGTVGNDYTLGEDTYNITRSDTTLTGGTD